MGNLNIKVFPIFVENANIGKTFCGFFMTVYRMYIVFPLRVA